MEGGKKKEGGGWKRKGTRYVLHLCGLWYVERWMTDTHERMEGGREKWDGGRM